MIANSLFNLIKQARFMKTVLRKYRDVLSPGKYFLIANFRSICLWNSETQDRANTYFKFENPSRLNIHAARVLNAIGYFDVGRKKTTDTYEAIYVANNCDAEREVKLFSFSTNRVLTICTTHECMCEQLQEYATLSHSYRMPNVERNERYENALNVEMINRMEFPGDLQALTSIAKSTMAYNKNPRSLTHKLIKEIITFSYNDDQINAILGRLAEKIDPQFLQHQLPICLQHGDLSKTNLIYGKARDCVAFWFIDWEHKMDRVFFYDYFFYLLGSSLSGETGALNCYLSGQNDEVLCAFFAHFGLEFDVDKRRDYALVFAICYLKERVCDLGNVDVLNVYCKTIETLLQIAGEGGEQK